MDIQYLLDNPVIILGMLIVVFLLFYRFVILILNPFFFVLNRLQYFCQRTHRFLYKEKSSSKRVLYFLLLPYYLIKGIVIYFLIAPLRLINAVYFNFIVQFFWRVRDHVLHIIAPKYGIGLSSIKDFFVIIFKWIILLPLRIIQSSIRILINLLESGATTIVDLAIPTLTLYHGTAFDSAEKITEPNRWKIGNGNFAGSGIYFGIKKGVARHYAHSQHGKVIIVARVTLFRNYPLAIAPKGIRNKVGNMGADGDAISKWAKIRLIHSVEHWRKDMKGWWEYCVVGYPQGDFMKTWRIRPLYVVGTRSVEPKRLKKGVESWLLNYQSILSFASSCLFIAAIYLFIKSECFSGGLEKLSRTTPGIEQFLDSLWGMIS